MSPRRRRPRPIGSAHRGHVDCAARLRTRGKTTDRLLYEVAIGRDDVVSLRVPGVCEDVFTIRDMMALAP